MLLKLVEVRPPVKLLVSFDWNEIEMKAKNQNELMAFTTLPVGNKLPNYLPRLRIPDRGVLRDHKFVVACGYQLAHITHTDRLRYCSSTVWNKPLNHDNLGIINYDVYIHYLATRV